MLTVKYLAYGDTIGAISEVEVSGSDTLIDLRKTIKNLNEDPVTFRDVDANNLGLYGIPIPDGDEQLKEALRHWTPTNESRLKGILKPLSSQNLSGSLIIVDVPEYAKCSVVGSGMTLNCWVSDEDDYRISQVSVSGEECISDLAEAIKNNNLAYLGLVSPASLILFKLSNPDRDDIERKLKDWALNRTGRLDRWAKVSDVLANNDNVLVFVNAPPPRRQNSVDNSELGEIARKRREWIEAYDQKFPPRQLPPTPFPTHFLSLQDGSLKRFEYLWQPVEGKFIYLGRILREKCKICVKFVQRYSREAHEACASLGCAPELLGFETLAEGQWFMVVMESINPDKYDMFLNADTVTNRHLQTIRKNAERLHERGYVHGDMRNVNIVLSTTDPRECMFLDFDWAGENGKVRYPVDINKGWDLWRPDRVVGGGVILAEDDVAMVDDLEKHVRASWSST